MVWRIDCYGWASTYGGRRGGPAGHSWGGTAANRVRRLIGTGSGVDSGN